MIEGHLKLITSLTSKQGPEPEDYPRLDDWFVRVHALASIRALSRSHLCGLRDAFGDAMSLATLQGFVCAKPHGYAGDFEIIDRIYTCHRSSDSRFARWDAYFQAHAAPTAVRNRKSYFQDLLCKHLKRRTGGPLRVLVIGSGPGRDIFEHFTKDPSSSARFDCVDIDSRAIAYAKDLNHAFADRIAFRQQNALLLRPSQAYDLIWAAGIFDYFNDRIFGMLLRNLRRMLMAEGELVIGNFSTMNPSRAYMEFGDWNLHHRSPEALTSLALQNGLPSDAVTVGSEPAGVNLFLHIHGTDNSLTEWPAPPSAI